MEHVQKYVVSYFFKESSKLTQYHYLTNCFFIYKYVVGTPPRPYTRIGAGLSVAAERLLIRTHRKLSAHWLVGLQAAHSLQQSKVAPTSL